MLQLPPRPKAHSRATPAPNSTDMAAALAAVATQEGRDARMPSPLLRMVADYLNLDQLMPPCRLRWSRLLRRPMMEMFTTSSEGDIIGLVFVEEIIPHNARILSYEAVPQDRFTVVQTLRWSSSCRGRTHRDIWEVSILGEDNEDEPFMEAWKQRYGEGWPLVGRERAHPALQNLYRNYQRFCHSVCLEAERYGGIPSRRGDWE